MASGVEEDYSQPVLPGEGASDYERYLRTDELLALQKTPEEMTHRDELLFQTVHQTSEIWLKLACFEVETATRHLRDHEPAAAARLLRRANDCVKIATQLLDMLDKCIRSIPEVRTTEAFIYLKLAKQTYAWGTR